MITESEMLDAVQKELSKQILRAEIAEAELAVEKIRKKKMKEVLQDCKQMFIAEKSFLVKCSRLEEINSIVEKINKVMK